MAGNGSAVTNTARCSPGGAASETFCATTTSCRSTIDRHGWPDAKALSLVGLYSGAMYALPAFGGHIADLATDRFGLT
jgi:hypothetical protein